MEFTREQIQTLLIEKITGTIDPKDDRALELLLAENVEIHKQWLDMNQQVRQAEAQGFSVHGNEVQSWQEIQPFLRPHRKRLITLRRMSGIAAVVAAVVIGILVIRAPSPLHDTESRLDITLSIDNGKIIRVHNAGSKIIKLGGTTIQLSDKELTCASAQTGTPQWCTLAVPITLDYKIRLPDGTEVWSNAETKLRFPFSFPGRTREVYIDGEAYFKVAKNWRQPFIVHTPQTDVFVTGTQFNVNTYNHDNIQTALVEGAVITKSAGRNQVNLKPGFKVIYNAQKGFRTEAFDAVEVLSWMKGIYYFHNAPLQELAKVLSRWYDVKVHFEKVSLQNKTFSGELIRQQSLQLFLDNLKLSAEVSSYTKDGVVYLK